MTDKITAHEKSYLRTLIERDEALKKLEIAREALEYIASVSTTDHGPIESVDLMSELANERLFDISKARQTSPSSPIQRFDFDSSRKPNFTGLSLQNWLKPSMSHPGSLDGGLSPSLRPAYER